MNESANPRLVRRCSLFASASAVFAVVAGLSVLAGWTFHIAILLTWGAATTMAPNAAAASVLAGISLWLLKKKDNHRFAPTRKLAARVASAVVALVGLLSLAQALFGLDLGIDRLLLATDPALAMAGARVRMSPIAAVVFLLLGLALLLIDWRTRREDWPAQFLSLGAVSGAAFGLLGLFVGPGVSPITLALPAVVTYFALAFGIVCSRASWAIGGLLTSDSQGARLLRKTVPGGLLALSLIGWLISKPLLTEEHFTWIEVSALAILCSVMLASFIAWIAFIVDRGDVERQKLEAALHIEKEQIDRLLNRIEEPQSEANLRTKVSAGFGLAIVLTCLLSLLSWRMAQQSTDDADWVAHTHEVSTALELALRHLVDVESGGRGFALTGSEPFLEPYETGRYAVIQNLQTLRGLVADNAAQERRLDTFEEQVNSRIEATQDLVSLRQATGKPPTNTRLLRDKQLMDEARATIAEMETAENLLLEQRTHSARAAARISISIVALGALLGVIFLSVAGATVSREITISARARAQVNSLNADLERRVAQRTAALGESEGRLAGVIQSATDSIITVDEEQRIVLFNSAAERVFRCPATDAMGQPINRFTPQPFHSAHEQHIRIFRDTDVTNRIMGPKDVLWAVRADGQEFQIEASISQVVTAGKKLFTVILRDVTEKVAAAEARERLAAIVEFSDDAIISKTLDGTITAWNHGAEKIFGYSPSEAVGQTMWMIMPPELANEEVEILANVGRGKSVEHFETTRVRKDGKNIEVSVTISPIRDGNGAVIGASKVARDITERKQAIEALRESDTRRKFALETAKLGDWELDLATLQAHRSLLHDQILGYPSLLPEWSFDIFLSHVHADDRERVRENIQNCMRAVKRWDFECRIVWPNGEIRWIWACGDPHQDSSGNATRVSGIVEDITGRKRAEEQLSAQARELASSRKTLEAQTVMFKLVLDNMGEGLIAADEEGHFLIWNDAAHKLMGRVAEDLPTEQWTPHYQVFLPDGITPYPPDRLPLVRALRGESVRVELIVQPPENQRGKFLEVTARPLMDAGGGFCGGVAVLHDITERKRVEIALAGQAEELSRQTEELIRSREALEIQTLTLRSVLDSMAEGLVVADQQGKFTIWNPAAERIIGLGPTTLPSQAWPAHYGFFLPDTVTPLLPQQDPLIRALHGEICTAETFVRNSKTPAGVWIEASASPLIDKSGIARGGVIAFRDITQRKTDEREIRQLNDELEIRVLERTAQLEAANKELEAFSYSVSHDLRAPLRHISGFSQMLVEELGPDLKPEAHRYLDRIQAGTQKMGLLVDELLNLARVGRHALKPRPTELNAILAEVIAMLEPETEGRQVEWATDDLPAVDCDAVLVKQVFQNLLANALKFTRPRTCAVIEVSQLKKRDADQRVFMVRDNGIGFSMKYVDKLFGVFQRLHQADDFEGSGIGLATVQRIVQKHGGRVWAEGEVDKGATFYFTLGLEKKVEAKSSGAKAGGQS